MFSVKITSFVNSFNGFIGFDVNYPKCDVEPKPVFWSLNNFCAFKYILVYNVRDICVRVADHELKLIDEV
jgi:hypothetical protein